MNDWRSYDDVAETYERVHAPRFAQPASDLVSLAGVTTGMRVLDVGTGTGVAAEAAATAGAWVVGIDRSRGMVAVGSRARPKLTLIAADAVDLPFPAGVFDAVVSNFVLAQFTKAETALHDIVRVLRPGGAMAMSVWADRLDDLQQAWTDLALQVVPKDLLTDAMDRAQPGRVRFADREHLQQTLARAGLQRVRVEPRRYRFDYGVDEYVDGLGAFTTGRFVRSMLGEAGWASFLERAKTVFRERFADPLGDSRDALLAVGHKPAA
jgi:ubiquinone/menaquinone biosynthesis C-methylase UbiE